MTGVNMIDNPFRDFWAYIWRFLYLIPGQFNHILGNIFTYISIEKADKTLQELGLSSQTFTTIGLAIVAIVIVFQVIWNHLIGIDDDNIGQNKIGTTVKKSVFAIIIACTAITFFSWLDYRVGDIVSGGLKDSPQVLSAKDLVKISANDFFSQQLDETDITKVKGCEGVNNRAEYLKKDKDGNYKGLATANDIYNCYNENVEYHDVTDDGDNKINVAPKLKNDVLKAQYQGIGKADTHLYETNNLTLFLIGVVSSISLIYILLHFFKIKWEIITGILFSPLFAAGLVSKKSSAWQQFFKALIGKFISQIVMVFLLIFSIKFLAVTIKSIGDDGGDPVFISIFKCIICIAMFSTIASGSVYLNNFIGQSGATGGSGGNGMIAGAGIGGAISNMTQGKNQMKGIAGGIMSATSGAKNLAVGKNFGQKDATGNRDFTPEGVAGKVVKGANHVASEVSANKDLNNIVAGQNQQKKYNSVKAVQNWKTKNGMNSNKTNSMPSSGDCLNEE